MNYELLDVLGQASVVGCGFRLELFNKVFADVYFGVLGHRINPLRLIGGAALTHLPFLKVQ